MTHEELPLSEVFREVFVFLTERSDAVLVGAHAVNSYAAVERMTQDVDVLTTDARLLAEAIRQRLAGRFHIAVRVQEVEPGVGYRVYQLRDVRNRHLVDIRHTSTLPPHIVVDGVRVVELVELIAMKVTSMVSRRGREKGLSDRLDLHRLLNAFPALRAADGDVAARLMLRGEEAMLPAWREVVTEQIEADPED